jgi:hypothetical protein
MISIHFEWSGTGQRTIYDRDGVTFSETSVTFLDHPNLPLPRVMDGFVFPALFPAMSAGETLRVGGPMSRKALRNARTLIEAWSRFKPQSFKPIELEATTLVDDAPQPLADGEAIGLFSGGLDATFMALRHTSGAADRFKLRAAVLVCIDVIGNEVQDFDRLRQRTRPFLLSRGIEPIAAICTRRPLAKLDWQMTHGAEFASVLHAFSNSYRTGMIASSGSYDNLILPYGSSPATDYLLSGSDLDLIHDGAGYSRAEKAELVGLDPIARETLQVCWQGKDRAANCGVCLKCVLTRLNFIAAGHGNIPAFPGEFHPDMLDGFQFHSVAATAEFGSLLNYVDRHGLTGLWVDKLRAKIKAAASPASAKAAKTMASRAEMRRTKEYLERGRLVDELRAKRPIIGRLARLLYRASSYIARRFGGS